MLKKILLLGTICSLMLVLYSWTIEPGLLVVRHVAIPTAKVHEGRTLFFLSDIHLPVSNRLERKILQAIERNRPDAILLGGDLVEGRDLGPSMNLLRKMKAFAPVIMVRGNAEGGCCCNTHFFPHRNDYTEDTLLPSLTTLLINNRTRVPNSNIAVYGLEGTFDNAANLDTLAVFRRIDSSVCNILLVHNACMLAGKIEQFDLACAGHTHGGQVAFMAPILKMRDRSLDTRHHRGVFAIGGTILVVTSGIGTSRLPVRLGVPPEVYVIKFKPA